MQALDLAKYIISRCYEAKEPINNLKLQKMLYFLYGYYYREFKRPLFDDKFVAWKLGPVILDVYFKYNQYIAKPICEKYNDVALMLSNQQIRFIKDKIDELNSLSGWDLTYKSRDTLPWKNTFKDGKGKGNIIKTQMIKDYFLGGKI